MSRARSALAVRTTTGELIASALKAFGCEQVKTESMTDFDSVLDFCHANSEELGGAEGCDCLLYTSPSPRD